MHLISQFMGWGRAGDGATHTSLVSLLLSHTSSWMVHAFDKDSEARDSGIVGPLPSFRSLTAPEEGAILPTDLSLAEGCIQKGVSGGLSLEVSRS